MKSNLDSILIFATLVLLIAIVFVSSFGCSSSELDPIEQLSKVASIAREEGIEVKGSIRGPLSAEVWMRNSFGAGSSGYVDLTIDNHRAAYLPHPMEANSNG